MRGRFLFCAALVAAAYMKGRADGRPADEDWLSPPPAPAHETWRAATEVAATATVEERPAPAVEPAWPGGLDDTTLILAALAAEADVAARETSPPAPPAAEPVVTAGPAAAPEAVEAVEPDAPEAAFAPAPEVRLAEEEASPVVEEVHAGWAARVESWDAPEVAVEAEVCGPPDAEGVILDLPGHEEPIEEEPVTLEAPFATAVAEPVPAPAPAPDPVEAVASRPPIAAVGPFAISGVAANAGDLAFGRVTFPSRLDGAPSADDVTLTVEHSDNLHEEGISVMRDGGFGPSREGLTLVVSARAPGRFVVRGHYTVRDTGAAPSA